MIEFQKLGIQNVLSYKKASIKFDGTIKRIFGLNKDATDEVGSTGNGVGKSLLFSVITNMLYFHSPLSVVKTKTKDIIGDKSKISLTLRSSGTSKRIVQSKSFDLFEDNVELKTRTIPLSKLQIRKWFPLSEEEFFTTTYVSSQRPYALQQSTNIGRLDLLSNLFQLNDYNKLKEVFAQKLRSVKDLKIKASVYKQQLDDKVAEIAKLEGFSPKRFEALEKEVSRLSDALNSSNKELHEHQSFGQQLSAVVDLDKELSDEKLSYKYKEKPSVVLVSLEKLETAWENYDAYRAVLQSINSDVREIKDELKSGKFTELDEVDVDSSEGLDEKIRATKDSISSTKQTIALHEDRRSKIREIKSGLEDLGVSIKEAKQVDLQDIEEKLGLARSILGVESLLEESDSLCPTCGSTFDKIKLQKSIDGAKKSIAKYSKLRKAKALVEDIPKAVEGSNTDLGKLKESLEEDLKVFINRKRLVTKTIELRAEREALKSQLSKLRTKRQKVTVVDKPSTKFIPKELDLVRSILDKLKAKSALLKAIGLPKDSTIKEIKKLWSKQEAATHSKQEVSKKLELDLSVAADEFDKIKIAKRAASLLQKEIDTLRAKLKELSPELKKERIYGALTKTYSSKGLKIHVLQNLCGLIQDNLNLYSPLVFNEKFSFSTNVSTKGVEINVRRPNGLTSDIRNLSGAESNCLVLLAQLSVLPLLPQNRRTNLLILDEPLSNCDTTTRRKIIENYFPVLHKVVSNIVFISNTPEEVENAIPYTVIKEDGISKLVEGNLSSPL